MSASAGMMPELGSKISLISKADIRYEGRLFTVDPQECTIALANGKFLIALKCIIRKCVLLRGHEMCEYAAPYFFFLPHSYETSGI